MPLPSPLLSPGSQQRPGVKKETQFVFDLVPRRAGPALHSPALRFAAVVLLSADTLAFSRVASRRHDPVDRALAFHSHVLDALSLLGVCAVHLLLWGPLTEGPDAPWTSTRPSREGASDMAGLLLSVSGTLAALRIGSAVYKCAALRQLSAPSPSVARLTLALPAVHLVLVFGASALVARAAAGHSALFGPLRASIAVSTAPMRTLPALAGAPELPSEAVRALEGALEAAGLAPLWLEDSTETVCVPLSASRGRGRPVEVVLGRVSVMADASRVVPALTVRGAGAALAAMAVAVALWWSWRAEVTRSLAAMGTQIRRVMVAARLLTSSGASAPRLRRSSQPSRAVLDSAAHVLAQDIDAAERALVAVADAFSLSEVPEADAVPRLLRLVGRMVHATIAGPSMAVHRLAEAAESGILDKGSLEGWIGMLALEDSAGAGLALESPGAVANAVRESRKSTREGAAGPMKRSSRSAGPTGLRKRVGWGTDEGDRERKREDAGEEGERKRERMSTPGCVEVSR